FIDSLLKLRGLTPREKDEIRARVTAPTADAVLQRASRLLSAITQHAAVIITPDPGHVRFGPLQFVPLKNGKLLSILVATDGRIENKIPALGTPLDESRLERIHAYLNDMLKGLTLDEVRERVLRGLGEDKASYDAL